MPIQDVIDDHIKDKKEPRFSMVINNETGSFKLPQGAHATLRDCSEATLDSNEGDNHANFSNCKNITITKFSDGVLRCEGESEVQKATIEKCIALFSYPKSVQDLDSTDSEVDLVGCDSVQKAKVTKGELRSRKNKYEDLSLDGVMTRLDQDEIQKLTVENNSNIQGFDLKLQDKGEFTGSTVFLNNSEATDEVTVEDCYFVDNGGSYKDKFTGSGDQLICILNDSEIKDDAEINDGMAVLSKAQCQGKLTVQDGSLQLKDSLVKDDFSFKNGELLIVGGTLKKTDVESGKVFARDSSFDEITIKDSAWESVIITGKKFKQDGGTIDSKEDEFDDEFTLTKMIGINLLYKTKAKEFKADGVDSAILNMMEVEREDTTISKFAKVEMSFGTGKKLTLSDTDMFVANDETFDDVDVQDCCFVVLNNCKMKKVTAAGVGTFLINGGTADEVETDTCGFANTSTCNITKQTIGKTILAVTKECNDLTSTKSVIADNGSTFTTASDSTLLLVESTVSAATKCNIQSKGGDITAAGSNVQSTESTVTVSDKSVVTSKGGTVTNPDGLSMGTELSLTDSAGILNFDGTDLTLQGNLGIVKIQSTIAAVEITAPAGSINSHALLNITEEAGGSITESATTAITNESSGTVAYTGTTSATMEATAGAATVSASAEATVSGANTNIAGTAAITLSAPIINEN